MSEKNAIDEELSFGIDLGIGSCGWAVLRHPKGQLEDGIIEGWGSWCFDVPETDKERRPTNQIRRANRLLRRVIRRRRNRMAEIRRLFHMEGLLPSSDSDALRRPKFDPWAARANGLDQLLSPFEFAAALSHIAKRRGFKSAAKNKSANAVGDDQKMLKELETTRGKLAKYQTVGKMFFVDPEYKERRRNRDGVYDRTVDRAELSHEVDELFTSQRRLGQKHATSDLQKAFKDIAFFQRPLQDSERLVGMCHFEPSEKRTSKLAPSFEKFRLLTRLVNLRIVRLKEERPLTIEELQRVTADLGKTAKLSVKKVRSLIGLSSDEFFANIKAEDEGQDIAVRTGDALPGTATLRKALGAELWDVMQAHPEQLDAIAQILSFYETSEKIFAELEKLNLSQPVSDRLQTALNGGLFAKFRGVGHISAKACRNLMPHLAQGLRYDAACKMAGYDHAASRLFSDRNAVTTKAQFNELVAEVGSSIANPIARKALTEGMKQLWAMRNRWGLPGSINIELARDVGNSLEKRRELEKGVRDNTAQRERERDEARDLLGLSDINGDTLLRYRLWKEQGGRCLYSGDKIPINLVRPDNKSVQVDHILPWSRFGDDSYKNKTLCYASFNQAKKNKTPYEWLGGDKASEAWETFQQRIETNKELRGFKKRNYLLKNVEEAQKKFRERNLNDTRYAARALAGAVEYFYPQGQRKEKGGIRRVYTRPGALTSALRHAWGLEALKKIDGKRVSDDRHHALDALVVAAVNEAQVQSLTKSYQEWEQQGWGRPLRNIDMPWGNFRTHVLRAYDEIFVARPERRRARGKGHDATIRQVKTRDEKEIVFERKAVTALKETDLALIKDPEKNARLIEVLREWIAAGKPTEPDHMPRMPNGYVVNKVRLASRNKPAVPVRGGSADRGEMVRVDVFSKPNKKGKVEWFLVPIYPHQVMNKKAWPQPPMRAVVAHKDESEWTIMGPEHCFRFSLYPRTYLEAVKTNKLSISGYFAGLDRAAGAINLNSDRDPTKSYRGIGVKTLANFTKYSVDRYGTCSEVKKEVRTWHGKACTSHSPPD